MSPLRNPSLIRCFCQAYSSLEKPRVSVLHERRAVYINLLRTTTVMLAVYMGLEPMEMSITINGTTLPIYNVDELPNARYSSIPIPATLLDRDGVAELNDKFAQIQATRDKFYITDRQTTEMFQLFPSAKADGVSFSKLKKYKQDLDASIEKRFPLVEIPGGHMVSLLPFLQELISLRGLDDGEVLEIIVGADGRNHTTNLSSILWFPDRKRGRSRSAR